MPFHSFLPPPQPKMNTEEQSRRPLVSSGRLISVSLTPVAVADIEIEEPHLNVTVKPKLLEFPRYTATPTTKPPARKVTIVNNGPTPIAYKLLTSDNNAYGVSSKFGIVDGRTQGNSHRVDVRIFRKPADPRQGSVSEKPMKNSLQVMITSLREAENAEQAFSQPDVKCDRYRVLLFYTAIPVTPSRKNGDAPLVHHKK